MATEIHPPLFVSQRRRAMRLANWNAGVWAIGNGLASSQLVVYLALEFDAPKIGLGIGFLLAAPHLVGLLRLGAPALIGRLADRKRFCVGAYLLSGLVLAVVPVVAVPGRLPSAGASLAALVALWCAYHLLEYLGTVALWSWLADLVPQKVRGRFIGRRERWLAIGQAVGMMAGGLFVWGWHTSLPELPRWMAYQVPAALGAGYMIVAAVPLAAMPGIATGRLAPSGLGLRALLAPLADRRFAGLLLFGCWLSSFNGMIQSPQNIFPNQVLHLSLLTMLALKVGLRLGQWTVSPTLGRLVDRLGNRPVMAGSLLVVAQGPLFYCLASRQQPWWIAGAWICWVAWAGLNVGLPNLMLKLSPRRSNTPYIATWFAVTGLCHGLSTILGGRLFDLYRHREFTWLGTPVNYYQAAFLAGWITVALAVVLLLVLVREPRGDVASAS